MRSKIPLRPTPLPHTPTSAKPIQPTGAVNPSISNTAARLSETFKRRRLGVWAVGVAIIVGAGAITGGEIRERQKAKERIAAQATGQDNVTGKTSEVLVVPSQSKSADGPQTASTITQPQGPILLDAVRQAPANTNNTADVSGRGTNYDQRQVMYLEDRRAVLMRQKFDVEQKLERVREKKKREEEAEGHRGAGVRGAER